MREGPGRDAASRAELDPGARRGVGPARTAGCGPGPRARAGANAGVSGESSLSRRPVSAPPSSPDLRLTPELCQQQRQQQLGWAPGARGGGEVEVLGSHGQGLGVGGRVLVNRCPNKDPHPQRPSASLPPTSQPAGPCKRRPQPPGAGGGAVPARTAVMGAIILMRLRLRPLAPAGSAPLAGLPASRRVGLRLLPCEAGGLEGKQAPAGIRPGMRGPGPE